MARNARQAQKTPLLGDLDGWRLPFGVVGGLCVTLWGFSWVWWQRQARPAGHTVAFLARFTAVSRSAGIRHVLGANALGVPSCGLAIPP